MRSTEEIPQLVIKQLLRPILNPLPAHSTVEEPCPEDNFLTEYLANHALTALPPGEVIHRIAMPPAPARVTPHSHRRVVSSCMPEHPIFLDDLFQETKGRSRVVVSSLGLRRPKALSTVPVRMEICGNRMTTPNTDLRHFTKSSFSPVRHKTSYHRSPIKIPQPKPHRRFESLDATTQSAKPPPLYAEWSSDSLSSSGHMPPITRNLN